MALMDDRAFLLSHIRNSFITSDDTGICEIVLEGEDGAEEERPHTWHPHAAPTSDNELSHSPDIVPDMDFASHRRRSNTAQRLEKLKREKHNQSKIKHVQWKASESPQDSSQYFEKKEVVPRAETDVQKKSKFSSQLETFNFTSQNEFMEYAKFDGRSSGGLPTKKIEIFLTMASPRDRPYPMTVVTLTSAKVQELIGLICWQYTQQGRQPVLQQLHVENYRLHMAEDDGEVDLDLPPLDHREPMSKFGFAKLALVAKKVTSKPTQPSFEIKVYHADGFSAITLDSDAVTLKEVMEIVMERRKIKQRRGLVYCIEKKSEPGVSCDLDASVGSCHTRDLVLLRVNSVREDVEREEVPSNEIAESLTSHRYKSYIVHQCHKISIPHTDSSVQLGIAGEKIEIDPVASKSKFFRQKAVTYDTEFIASCTLLEGKSSGKAMFRIVHLKKHAFKELDFECDATVAKEIVAKINHIMDMRASSVRGEYKAHRERKMSKRHTLNF